MASPDGSPLPYRAYSPKRSRPNSLVALAGTHDSAPASYTAARLPASSSFTRPGKGPIQSLTSQHGRSQSMNALGTSTVVAAPLDSLPSTRSSTPISLLPSPALRADTPPPIPRSETTSPTPSTSTARPRPAPGKAPYLPGFQPAGVWRSRTDELVGERVKRGESRRLETVRIGRRLAKLVDLHFINPPPSPPPSRSALSRAASVRSSLSAEFDALRVKSPGEVWGRVLRGVKGARAEDIRAAEQAIVKWEDDLKVSRCAICAAPFSFSTRKHHCRLCGRVCCFLPPTPQLPPSSGQNSPSLPLPSRPVRCTTFIRYELDPPKSDTPMEKSTFETRGRIVELEIRDNEPVGEGVRVCKDCLAVVLRRQAVTHPPRTPNYVKLHEVLLQLQDEIEGALPDLQEMIIALSRPNPSTAAQRDALAARKRLLTSLASYDSLSKRIRDLPDTPPGSSRDRLQRAVQARAQLFLAEKMALLKGLGFDELEAPTPSTPPIRMGKGKSTTTVMSPAQKKELEERAAKLVVLLEQEQLVQSYWEDANSRRQLEDAASLKASLDELRGEIRALRGQG